MRGYAGSICFSIAAYSFRKGITMKKILFLLLLVLTVLTRVSAAEEKEMNIALWKLPLNLPAIAAFQDKTYEKAFAGEVKVNHVQLPSGPKQIQALGAGQLDIGEGLGTTAVLVGATAGADIKIIGVCSRSPRGFAIVVSSPEIRAISDLKGKKVAGVKGSVVHQLYVELMEESGLTERDAEFFPTTLSAATSALLVGRVDAALLAGTEIVRAENGGARVLADGEGRLTGLSLIVARTKFIEDNPEVVDKYLRLRQDIIAAMKINPDKFITITAKETGTTEQEAKNIMDWYDFNDKITSKDIEELNKTLVYLEKMKMIREQVDIMRIIY